MTLSDIGVSPEYQWIASVAGALLVGLLAAWGRIRGKAEGPPKTTVTEFAMSPVALSDMKPVRDLVAALNALVDKIGLQVEADARTALALEGLARAYAEQIETQKDEAAINKEIERRWSLVEAAGGNRPASRTRTRKPPNSG